MCRKHKGQERKVKKERETEVMIEGTEIKSITGTDTGRLVL